MATDAAEGIVGRVEELRSLDAVVAALARSRAAGVTCVSGEPGIGKTRLLSTLAARAAASGAATLQGRAQQMERAVPFAAVVDALDDHVASLPPRTLERIGPAHVAELARVLPSLGPSSAVGRGEGERYRLHRAVRALLETLAAARPVLLSLDDMHWADGASVELVLHLLRRPPRARVGIALGFRSAGLPGPLAAGLAAAEREGTPVLRLALGPLTEAETRALVAGTGVDEEACRALVARSGGNPFYAEQLARVATRPEAAPARQAVGDDVPPAVQAAIAEELEALPAAGALLLRGAAIAGDPFELDLAAAASGCARDEARAVVDALLAADLVRPAAAPGRFRFRHPIVRAAVHASAGAGWRLGAHARVADALRRRGAPPSARAHHVECSARRGDWAAAAELAEAAREVAAHAPATAARWLEAALALTPAAAGTERVDLLVPLARALAACGRLAEAGERLQEALRLVAPPDAARRVQLVAMAAGIDRLSGRHRQAGARLASALDSLGPDPSPERCAIEIELAAEPGYTAAVSAASARGENALRTAEALGDPGLQASAAAALTVRANMLGRVEEALRHARTAAALVDELDDRWLAARLDAPHHLGGMELYLSAYADAERHLSRGVALSRATGSGRFIVPLLTHLARAQAMLGRIAPARQTAEDAVDAARLAGVPALVLWALLGQCMVEVQAGDFRVAAAAAREGQELAGALETSMFTAKIGAYHGLALLELGEPERCAELIRAARAARVDPEKVTSRAPLWEALAIALLALGRRDEAARVGANAERAAAGVPLPMPRCHARRIHAALELDRGDPAAAAGLALAAAADAERAGARIEAARSRTVAAGAFAAAGDHGAAIAHAEHAHRQLSACGAAGHADRAAAVLRGLGRRVVRSGAPGSGAGVAALSARELEVARLVADGMSNKEIAARLFLSEKTIETHLARAFIKVGVNRRAALASRIAEEHARA